MLLCLTAVKNTHRTKVRDKSRNVYNKVDWLPCVRAVTTTGVYLSVNLRYLFLFGDWSKLQDPQTNTDLEDWKNLVMPPKNLNSKRLIPPDIGGLHDITSLVPSSEQPLSPSGKSQKWSILPINLLSFCILPSVGRPHNNLTHLSSFFFVCLVMWSDGKPVQGVLFWKFARWPMLFLCVTSCLTQSAVCRLMWLWSIINWLRILWKAERRDDSEIKLWSFWWNHKRCL